MLSTLGNIYMIDTFFLKALWLIISPEVLAFQYRSGLQDNGGTLWDVVDPTRKFGSLSEDTLAASPSFQGVGIASQNPITHLNHQQQEFSTLGTYTHSIIQPGTQEESIPHREKRQKLAELDLPGDQESSFHAGVLSTSEPTEWLSSTANIEGSLGHQAEAYPQPFKPPTAQTSHILLPGYDSLHDAGLDSFQPASNIFHLTSTSKGPEPSHQPDSRSSHFDASLSWPSDLDSFHEQQSLKQLDKWLNGADFLETITNPTENHQEEQSMRTDLSSEESNFDESAFLSQLLVDHDIFHEQSEQIDDSHGVISEALEQQRPKPTVIQKEDHSLISKISSEASEPRHIVEYLLDKDSGPRRTLVDYEKLHDQPEKSNSYFTLRKDNPQNDMRETGMTKHSLESLLRIYSYPKESMSGIFSARFTKKFEREINAHFLHYKVRKKAYSTYKMKDFSAIVSPVYRGRGKFIVRPIGKPADNEDNYTGKTLTGMFDSLLQWLIFINTTMLRSRNQKVLYEEELSSHERVTDWLLAKSFRPLDNSFPVLGIVTSPTAKTFGTVQAPLVRYLTEESSTTDIIKLCVIIIQQHHRETNHKFDGCILDERPDLIPHIEALLYEATNSRIRVDNFEQSLAMPIDRIGSFKIPDLSLFPESYKPTESYIIPPLGKYAKEIWDTLNSERAVISKMERTPVLGLPVELVGYQRRTITEPTLFNIKIIRKTGFAIHKDELKKKLQSLFYHLGSCHRLAFHHLVSHKDNALEIPTDDTFFQWITNMMLAPGYHYYPLFGEVELLKSSIMFEASNFNEVQIYLLNYFSDTQSDRIVIQVSLALIGYWYRTYFESDQTYWNTMISSLKNYPRTYTN
ncbi:hypothetical protein PGT21_009751 [Puccinia graminis f. sp. tritici]|uniref:Uncharacterized protein n=1 Tax=Puccinia graminis f. sp. tritici TaxID=56615 RepID=A0A5B0ML61_PUCGR|nr:hypothetical protein PGT21_009751 [Puccinia graminis f. sp. tritici]